MLTASIVLLMISAILFVLFGRITSHSKMYKHDTFKLVASIFINLILAISFCVVGNNFLYLSAQGEISLPQNKPSTTIYSVRGLVETSQGTVAIVENGEQKVLALWDSYDGFVGLPAGTKFARIAKNENKKWRLVPIAP